MKCPAVAAIVLGGIAFAVGYAYSGYVHASTPPLCGPVVQCDIDLACSQSSPRCLNIGAQQSVNPGADPPDAQIGLPVTDCGAEASYYNYIYGCTYPSGGCGGKLQANCDSPL